MKYFETSVIDYGVVPVGTTREVAVKYVGPEDFNMNELSTSCGCTDKSFDKETQMITFKTNYSIKGEKIVNARYKGDIVIIKAIVE